MQRSTLIAGASAGALFLVSLAAPVLLIAQTPQPSAANPCAAQVSVVYIDDTRRAYMTFMGEIDQPMAVHRDQLVGAYLRTDLSLKEQNNMLSESKKLYKEGIRTPEKKLKTAIKTIAKAYKAAVKVCKTNPQQQPSA